MELLQLKYFCDAAETQNFSKTADKFMVPPSGISQTIKRLEKELGTPLFDRHANRIALNEAGLLFYKKVKTALDLLENAGKSLKAAKETITIKINIRIARRVVMEAIEDFRRIYPNIHFVTAHNTDTLSGEYDIIVTDEAFNLPYRQTLAAEETILLAYNRYKFSFPGGTTDPGLIKAPFITMANGNSMYDHTLKACQQLGFTPNIVLQSEDPFYIRKCIELGLGIAFVPSLSWKGQFSEDIAFADMGKNRRNIYIYEKYGANDPLEEFHALLLSKFSV